ncbi:MAG: AAA family ATPase [Myxococcota bacterium]
MTGATSLPGPLGLDDPFRLVEAAVLAHAAAALPPDAPERLVLGEGAPARLDVARFRAALRSDDPRTQRLAALATALGLTDAETAAVALAVRVEDDLLVGRILAGLQAPVGGSRPTLGLLQALFAGLGQAAPAALVAGRAVATGLLQRLDPERPLPEQAVAVPTALVLALEGHAAPPAGVADVDEALPLPPSRLAEAAERARSLVGALAVRAGHRRDALAAAAAVARAQGARPVLVADLATPGLGPWLLLAGAVPLVERRLGPGERLALAPPPGHAGPVLACTGPVGIVTGPDGPAPSWRLGPVPEGERAALWQAAVGGGAALGHRHGPARIHEIGRIARQAASGRAVTAEDLHRASLDGDAGGLSVHAQLLPEWIADGALVVPDRIRDELGLILARCRLREALGRGLGVAATTRLGPGVRCLFLGPPGTGKTLAAGWLAARLGLPLYRVDMASVVSKYIGETERHLAELLALAEAAEVVLLFDEADALFGKRTDVRHSTDRYANAQTNYLLQRIESYDGVVVLASNSRDRFDEAMQRRLDVLVEFPLPGPTERRALWVAHLGEAHALTAAELNKLATHCDLAGGHVRNAVLGAAVLAAGQRPIGWGDVERALALEYRKVGKVLPRSLAAGPR